MKKVQKFLSYVLVAALSSMITMCLFDGTGTNEYNKLTDMEQLIETYFIGQADHTAMQDAAATAMVGAIGDKWSYYMPAQAYKAYTERMQNGYVGVGITITPAADQKGFLVTQVNKGGAAEEAGMIAGDVILAIEGQPAEGMTTTQARDLVCGEEGTKVKMTISRGGETIELAVKRKMVETPAVEAQILESGIGLITIYNFNERCAQESIAAVEDLIGQGADALIFDVRGNPGGYKEELVALLDYLLPEGVIFRGEYYTGEVEVKKSDAAYLDMPMAVLVDGNSYSAAEFFAAALDEYDAAIVVGQPTSGKGYFQSTFQMNDGSAVSLSVGKYTTPEGVSLEGVGIVPEVQVDIDEETMRQIYAGTLAPEEDPQIQAAVEALKEK